MKKNNLAFILLLLLFIGCSSTKELEYQIPNQESFEIIRREVMATEKANKDLILVFGKGETDSVNTINVLSNPWKMIQNFEIKYTQRYLTINSKKYKVLFETDFRMGGYRYEGWMDGEKCEITMMTSYMYEFRPLLYFDADWKFIKKEYSNTP